MLEIEERDPMVIFKYGLRAPDTRRQYPRRFQYFLNFLRLPGALEEQAVLQALISIIFLSVLQMILYLDYFYYLYELLQ